MSTEFDGLIEGTPNGVPEKPARAALVTGAGEPFPDDIERVWGGSETDRRMAAHLIDTWGLDRFRRSALHQVALGQLEREVHSDLKPEAKGKGKR